MNTISRTAIFSMACLLASTTALAGTNWEDSVEKLDARARPYMDDTSAKLFTAPYRISLLTSGKYTAPRISQHEVSVGNCFGAYANNDGDFEGKPPTCFHVRLRDDRSGNVVTLVYDTQRKDNPDFAFVVTPKKQRRVYEAVESHMQYYEDGLPKLLKQQPANRVFMLNDSFK